LFSGLRNVSGEGDLNGKNPPPKKRVRALAYQVIVVRPPKSDKVWQVRIYFLLKSQSLY
jgi:hypothetical protein